MERIRSKLNSYFNNIEFKENGHIYEVNGQKLKYSVSGLIEFFIIPFNREGISKNTAKNRGISQAELLKEWDAKRDNACSMGNKTHSFGEGYMFNRVLIPETGLERAVVKFWNDLPSHIIPVIPELIMYHKEYLFAGTADVLLYNTTTGKFIICDYKTNEDLFKNFAEKKMLKPFGDLLCCPFNHYQLQLSFYQILLEQSGIEVSGRKVIWLQHDGTYKIYDTKDYREPLIKYLKTNEL